MKPVGIQGNFLTKNLLYYEKRFMWFHVFDNLKKCGKKVIKFYLSEKVYYFMSVRSYIENID